MDIKNPKTISKMCRLSDSLHFISDGRTATISAVSGGIIAQSVFKSDTTEEFYLESSLVSDVLASGATSLKLNGRKVNAGRLSLKLATDEGSNGKPVSLGGKFATINKQGFASTVKRAINFSSKQDDNFSGVYFKFAPNKLIVRSGEMTCAMQDEIVAEGETNNFTLTKEIADSMLDLVSSTDGDEILIQERNDNVYIEVPSDNSVLYIRCAKKAQIGIFNSDAYDTKFFADFAGDNVAYVLTIQQVLSTLSPIDADKETVFNFKPSENGLIVSGESEVADGAEFISFIKHSSLVEFNHKLSKMIETFKQFTGKVKLLTPVTGGLVVASIEGGLKIAAQTLKVNKRA